ncbi:hypothetical protein ElyMa_004865500, partial [Elysia marginata]
VGIVLYNPLGLGWDQTEVTYVNLAGIHFLWHLLANLAVAMTTSTITALAFRQAIDNNSGLSQMTLKSSYDDFIMHPPPPLHTRTITTTTQPPTTATATATTTTAAATATAKHNSRK